MCTADATSLAAATISTAEAATMTISAAVEATSTAATGVGNSLGKALVMLVVCPGV